MSLRKVSVIGYFLLNYLSLTAQPFGGNPPSLNWRQVSNDTVRVIFPAGLDSQAQQVASIAGALGRTTLPTIGHQQRKINIIFQNQTTVANGYVQLAPFRSEFQLTADQNSFQLGSLPWQEQLVIHEYRHVQQYNNYRIGLSKWFYYLFGEGGQELANSLSVPNWFWEGDAVYQETLVSRQGRGRLPAFFNGYRSLWISQKNYSWMKLRNGSLRDYVPDHYPLGYMMVAYGREKYGAEFWRHVTLDAAAFKGVFYPLQKGISRSAGISYAQFRKSALEFFRNQMDSATRDDSITKFSIGQKHFVADEEFPQFLDANHLVYVKTTYKRPHRFVVRDLRTGAERNIATRSLSLDNYFSLHNRQVVYAAYEPDLRWGWRDFSVLRILDLDNGTDRKITHHTKFFSPSFSQDGRRIVCINADVQGKTTLYILNAQTGAVEKQIDNPLNLYFSYPVFLDTVRIASAVRNARGEMALCLLDTKSGDTEWLTNFSMQVIGFPSVEKDTVYFSATRQGLDQIFAWHDHQIFELNASSIQQTTGNYGVKSYNGKLLLTSFTSAGFRIDMVNKESLQFRDVHQWPLPLDIQNISSLQKNHVDLIDSLSITKEPVKKYSTSFQLLNIHSWRPYISDPNYTFAVESENVMNTLQSEVFFTYNRNEQFKQIGVDATYGALFPWIKAGLNYTFDRNALYQDKKVYWNEAEGKVGMSVPLNLSKSKWITKLTAGSDLVYNQRYFKGAYKDSFDNRGFAYINPNISFTNQTQSAPQNIFPAFAQSISLLYNGAVTTIKGNQFLASGYFYFPGLTPTHSLVLAAAFQQRDSGNQVRFSNNFPFSRGYSGENFYRMYRLSANYHFPLFYPDWGFGDIVYFLRIRANAFFDYTGVPLFATNGPGVEQQYRSYGMELYFDTKWWNQLPISFGIRYSHLMDRDYEGLSANQFELILPMTLLGR
ncbi:MAG: hypothetical protein C5B59_01340 [Bacteroidetes bacterium]|nr:MAG: hypothetical protein C5B59_01340 [Bacteroidota bacterium]